ncbi:MAG: hypothetical protein R3C01_11945 [Planctomycetaceae bacterium]
MSRRRQEEMEFGSDAFLDVIANIVGILIILIVIAGVRVSQTPPRTQAALATVPPTLSISAPLSPVALAPIEPIESPSPVRTVYQGAPPPLTTSEFGPKLAPRSSRNNDIQISPLSPPAPREVLPIPSPDAELVRTVQALEAEQQALIAEEARLIAEQSQLQSQLESQSSALVSQSTDTTRRAAQAAAQRQELLEIQADIESTRNQLSLLRQNLNEASSEPTAKVIEHRMTPVGRLVEGKELHFRLERGRVTHVPIDDLAAELGNQIQRQRSIILRTSAYQGSVGPIDGYVMEYRIERARASLEDELKVGSQMIRMSVSQWTLLPQPGLVGETAQQAMQRDSEFYRTLLTSGPTTTLTFWTYPDSFALHRELQQFAQRHGYQVAARPLPEGVPIAGSPNGSKSIAQ